MADFKSLKLLSPFATGVAKSRKMVKTKLGFIAWMIHIWLSIFNSAEASYGNLSGKEIKRLEAGEFVVRERKITGEHWPEVRVFFLVEAHPIDVAGIFSAYDYQKEYLPKLIKSTPYHRKDAIYVDYESVSIWPLKNVRYTHAHYARELPGGVHQISWSLIKSTHAHKTAGVAQFHPYGGDKTLVYYKNFAAPKSFFATFLKRAMVKRVIASMEALRQTVGKLRRSRPELIEKYKNYLKRVYSGGKIY